MKTDPTPSLSLPQPVAEAKQPAGTWPSRCEQRAFVDGAAWWEALTSGATMWPADRDRAEAEAVRRFGEPKTEQPQPVGEVIEIPSEYGIATAAVLFDESLPEGTKLYAAPQPTAEQSQAARDVLAERQRQITTEGWTFQHDDEHIDGEIASAAGCYAKLAGDQQRRGLRCVNLDAPRDWPWASEWWKPKDRRSNLVRAAALILAEIERLDRAASKIGGGR